MTLPDFLEMDEGGFINLTGHRIGLHHVVRMYVDGSSVEMIAAHYPPLPLALIYRVIAFYLENQVEVGGYVLAHQGETDLQIAQGVKVPTLVELRERLKQIDRTASKSG